jgi:hypothetical protein
MNVGRPDEDPFDALIRHNQELLAWAGSIRKECQQRRIRCHAALVHAQIAYENALQRQKLWARRQGTLSVRHVRY